MNGQRTGQLLQKRADVANVILSRCWFSGKSSNYEDAILPRGVGARPCKAIAAILLVKCYNLSLLAKLKSKFTMTKSSQLRLGDHKSSEFIKRSHLSSDVLMTHNCTDFTASCCSFLSLIWNLLNFCFQI